MSEGQKGSVASTVSEGQGAEGGKGAESGHVGLVEAAGGGNQGCASFLKPWGLMLLMLSPRESEEQTDKKTPGTQP